MAAALAAVWARTAAEPVATAATASASVSTPFTPKETSTLRRVPSSVVSAIGSAPTNERHGDAARATRSIDLGGATTRG